MIASAGQLRRTCWVAAALGVAGLAAVAPLLSAPDALSVRFFAGALPAWGLVIVSLWRWRHLNHPVSARAIAGPLPPLLPKLGRATSVTLVRGWMIAVVAGHLLLAPVTGDAALNVGLIYTAAALLDGVDGRVARHGGTITLLGARLDVHTDALGLLLVPLVGVHAGRLPPWYLLLGAAYPLFRLGLSLRRRLGWPTFPERLRPDPRARFFAGVQMGVVAAAFYPVLPVHLVWLVASLAMLPTLALFAQEWRTATGALPRATPRVAN